MAEIAIAVAIAAAVSAATYTLSYALQSKPKPVERGRLQGQVQVQDSSYGSMIPWILGGDVGDQRPHGIRAGGNVIFLSDIRKVETPTPPTGGGGHGKGGGGGQAQSTTITYYVDIGICFGEPGAGAELDLQAMFAGTDLIYDVRPGAAGTGFVYEGEAGDNTFTGHTSVQPFSTASQGYEITLQQFGGGSGNGAVQFNSVQSNWDGVRTLAIYYRTGVGAPVPVEVTVNGGAPVAFTLPATNESYARWTMDVPMVQGANTVKIKNTGPTYNLGIDRIYVYPGADVAGDPLVPPVAPPTGVLDPYLPADDPYDPMLPLDPYDQTMLDRQRIRYGYIPPKNIRGELSTTVVNGGYAGLRWYPGNETQEPDPTIVAEFQKLFPQDYALGRDVTPAYLGRAYCVLQNFNISKYGSIPNFTAIIRNKNFKSAAQILTALCARSGVDTGAELDVTSLASSMVRGLAIINRQSVKQISADTLARRYPFDWTQTGGKLTTVMRGGAPVYDIPAAHLGFKSKNGSGKGGADTPNRVAVKQKLSETELPRRVEVKGFDPSRDFEVGTASAKRQVVTSRVERTLEINMALTIEEMRDIAQRDLDVAWLEDRQALGISIPHTYAGLVPTNVVTVNDGGSPTSIIHTMRIKEITGAIPGALEVVGVPTDAALYVPYTPPPPTATGVLPPVPATVIGTFIDSQYLRDRESYAGNLGYYVACTSLGNGEFRGANLWRDRGAGYEFVCNFPVRATMGIAATVINSGSTQLDVDLYADAELESYSSGEVAGGSGWVFSGHEAFQYTSATPVGGYPNRWRLSGLTSRGGKGSAGYVNAHTLGERFVFLNEALRFVSVDLSESGVARNHKFASTGMGLDDAAVVSYTWNVDTALSLPAPTGLAAAVVLNKIRWTWNHVADPNRLFSHYEVYRDAGFTNRLYRGDNNYFTEDLVTGTSTYPIYVRTFTKALTPSPTAASSTFVLSPVPDVANFAATWDGLDGTWTWDAVSDPNFRIVGYEIYNSSNTLIGFSDKSPFVFRPTTAATTLKIKALDAMGNRSNSFVSYTLVVANPAPPATATTVYDRGDLFTTWDASTSPGVLYYEVQDGAGGVLRPSVTDLFWRRKPQYGVASYTNRIFAVNRIGLKSSTYAQVIFNIPPPDPPVSLAGAWDGDAINWTFPASVSDNVDLYRIWTDTGSPFILWSGDTLFWREEPTQGQATYTRRVYAMRNGVQSSTYAVQTVTIPAPNPPATATGSFDGLNVIWKLTASTSLGVTHYVVKDTSGTVLADKIGLEWKEKCSAGVSVYTRRFYAVNKVGLISTSYTETTFTVPPPDPPTSYALSHELDGLLHTYAPPVALPDGLEYQVARANDGTQIITRRRDFFVRETGFAVSSRTLTRYARAINIAERLSTWVSASITVTAPATPTVTKDTAMARPNFLPINVATATVRSLIRQTILQVRASGAGAWPAVTEGTSGSRRFAGAPPTLNVDWDAGGAMEFRVAHIDEFSDTLADYNWSSTQTHTFPTFSDGALDPNSNFMRKANWRDPIYTGGGLFTWTTGFVVKWDAPIVVTGLSSIVSSSGQVTIAANTAGTSLATGQMLLAVQTLGATTATLLVVADDGTYTPPAETATTIHRRLFKRNADNTLSTYLGVPMPYNGSTDTIMDSRVLIPMLSTFDAVIFNALITNANIKDLSATKILTDALYGRIVFADKVGSQNFVASGSLTAQTEAVVWRNAVNVSILTDGSQQKTSANNWDGGATSSRGIFYGDGGVKLTAARTNIARMFGLSFGDTDQNYTDIDYAIYLDASAGLSVYEAGTARGSFGSYTIGDILEVVVTGTTVTYKKNGTVFYTSGVAATKRPLLVDSAIYNNGGVLEPMLLTGVLSNTDGSKVHWTNIVGVAFDAVDDLSLTGASGSWSSGTFSTDSFAAGISGYISAKAGATNKDVMWGLSTTDANQNYTSIGRAWYFANDGNCYIYEAGASIGAQGAYTTSTVLTVGREGANIVYRKDGVVIRTTTDPSSGGALFVDTSFTTAGTTLKSVRLFRAGAVGQGWQGSNNGVIEAGDKAIIGGVPVDAVAARSAKLFNAAGYYVGQDAGAALLHKVSAVTLESWAWDVDAVNHTFQISARIPYQSDAYINAASITQCECRVLNHFGDQVKLFAPFTFDGDGICAFGKYTAKYAHPEFQAIFALKFRNAFGWSQEIYLQNGSFSTTMPTLQKRAECFLEMNGSIVPVLDPTVFGAGSAGNQGPSFSFSGREPVSNYVNASFDWRVLGESSWHNSGALFSGGGRAGYMPPNSTGGLPAGALIEMRLKSDTAGTYSNVLLRKVPEAPLIVPDLYPCVGLSVWPDANRIATLGYQSNRIGWGTLQNATFVNVFKNGALALRQAVPFPSYTDIAVTPGTTDRYQVVAEYSTPTRYGPPSAVVEITFPDQSLATDPSNLVATNGWPGSGTIDCVWAVNSAVGTVYLDYKLDDGTYGSGWTTITLSAGTTSRSVTGLNPDLKRYAFRVRVSDAGTSPTNIAFAVTTPTGYRDY